MKKMDVKNNGREVLVLPEDGKIEQKCIAIKFPEEYNNIEFYIRNGIKYTNMNFNGGKI